MVSSALALAAQGFRVFPIAAGQKAPPLVNNWPHWATTLEVNIREWWAVYPDANVGIHCWGLLVVDVDPAKGGLESWQSLRALLDLPKTRIHGTPSGGFHVIYRLPEGHPGVANSVERRLGAGLDVRSTGGYIVGPGSRTAAGAYVVTSDGPIVEAPAALVGRAGRVEPKAAAKEVADAAPDALARAVHWLAGHPGAIQGDGGDAHTYLTACRLRDLGLSADQALEAMSGAWNGYCSPPWSFDELQTKVRNAYSYAQNEEGGAHAQATAAMFVAAPVETPPARRLHRGQELSELDPGPALWEGIASERSIFAIGAAPGRSKSYTATGLCYALATDAGEYLGRKIPKGTAAIYVDAERMGMTKLRVAVWCYTDKRKVSTLPLLFHAEVRLNVPDTVKALIEDIQAAGDLLGGRRISLVALDSLGAMLPGEELNSSSPATMVGAQLRRIRDSLGCAVCVVAHSPKSGDETVAGSLHFDAIFDTSIFVRSESGAGGSLYVKKDNTLALDEHERFTHWKAETLTAKRGDREVKVHRLVAGTAPKSAGSVKLTPKQAEAWALYLEMSGSAHEPVAKGAFLVRAVQDGISEGTARSMLAKMRRAEKVREEGGKIIKEGE